MTNIVAIVQARTESTRLPLKILYPFDDITPDQNHTLDHVLYRCAGMNTLDDTVVAIANTPQNQIIEEILKTKNGHYYKPDCPPSNLLARYYKTAEHDRPMPPYECDRIHNEALQ